MTRREALRHWATLPAAIAAVAGWPALRLWWRSARLRDRAAASWADLGPVSRLEEGRWLQRPLRLERPNRWRLETREEVVYVRRVGEALEVLSPVCPHAGCLVRRQGEGFACPCHRSRFDETGRSLEGPSPRPLDPLEWKLDRGRLLVRYQRFRPAVVRSEPLEA
jgi:Rieske Fe-S protein